MNYNKHVLRTLIIYSSIRVKSSKWQALTLLFIPKLQKVPLTNLHNTLPQHSDGKSPSPTKHHHMNPPTHCKPIKEELSTFHSSNLDTYF